MIYLITIGNWFAYSFETYDLLHILPWKQHDIHWNCSSVRPHSTLVYMCMKGKFKGDRKRFFVSVFSISLWSLYKNKTENCIPFWKILNMYPMVNNSTNINKTNNNLPPQIIAHKRDHEVGTPRPGLWHVHNCGGVKSVNGSHPSPLDNLISNYSVDINRR